jgi:hypothetical protein
MSACLEIEDRTDREPYSDPLDRRGSRRITDHHDDINRMTGCGILSPIDIDGGRAHGIISVVDRSIAPVPEDPLRLSSMESDRYYP